MQRLAPFLACAIFGCGSSVPPPPSSSAAPRASVEADDDEASPEGKKPDDAAPSGDAPVGTAKPRSLDLVGMTGAFPAKTAGDDVCWQDLGLSGKHDKDYDTLVAACGAPAGLREFTKKVSGKLEASHKADTWLFHMKGGWCYRFFVVADGTLDKLNLFIKRPNGALVSLHDANQPVLMVDPKGTWCKTHDRDFHIEIGARGDAHGQYTFGIWARPKPK